MLPRVFLFISAVAALQLKDDFFDITLDDDTGAIVSIRNPDDDSLNWVSSPENAPWLPLSSRWGLGYADEGAASLHRGFWSHATVNSNAASTQTSSVYYNIGTLNVTVERSLDSLSQSFGESYTFTNIGDSSLSLQGSSQSLAIYTPFNDHYTNSLDAQANRTHAHIWACGLTSSWIKATRMNGRGPHLGLVLTAGSLKGYSIEARDTVTSSNTRGVMLVHPIVPTLGPGESTTLSWTLFWHDTWENFLNRAIDLSDQFIEFNATSWTVFPNENTTITMKGAVDDTTAVAGHPVTALADGSGYSVTLSWSSVGEKSLSVSTGSGSSARNSTIVVNVVPDLDKLLDSRTSFIISNQQVPSQNTTLDGAYVVYDNQMDGRVTFDTASDRNSGRERVGMGVLMGRQLVATANPDLERSLMDYYRFVCTQLQRDDGYVYNGPGVDKLRVYNFPWVAQLHLQIAKSNMTLPEDLASPTPLQRFMLTLESMYAHGATDTYPIGVPVYEGLSFLKSAGNDTAHDRALELFIAHGQRIAEVGTDYPAGEVNYEQSLVAPAAILPLELYLYTGNETWITVAEPHFNLLVQFGGLQPDYHLHDVAIRHWDGYWFGKDRMWGDVFPHYWSTLTGLAMHFWGLATNDTSYTVRAEGIMRANLALFASDGSASCAWLYPLTVNGRAGHYKDAYANDQDWALAHYLQIRLN
jgi:hypothetical protein